MTMDSFAPEDTPGEYNEDGERLAPVRPDPATVDRFTLPYTAPEEPPGDPVPTATYVDDVAERETLERLLAEKAANADTSDRPHFLRNVDGREVCGQDGQTWPCDEYQAQLRRQAEELTGTPEQQPPGRDTVSVDAVAEALGMERSELEARLAVRDSEHGTWMGDVGPVPRVSTDG